MSRCAIVAAGEIRDYAAVKALLQPDTAIICADGGYRHCAAMNLTPHLLVGDFDSLGELPAGIETLRLRPDKNYTDSAVALDCALERGCTDLVLTGMLGGRLDHSLANLALAGQAAKKGMTVLLTDGIVEVHALCGPGELHLPNRPGCYFSLLALERCAGVTIHHGKYPLDNYDLNVTDPRAISNEFAGRDVRITQRSGLLLVTSEPK